MAKLFQRDNTFSTNRMKNSEMVDFDENTIIRGLSISCDGDANRFTVNACDGNAYRISRENADLIFKNGVVSKSHILGDLSWRNFRNKSLLLPSGYGTTAELKYGDIVEPVIYRKNSPSSLLYLGKMHNVEYSGSLVKTVRKDQHVFVALESAISKKFIQAERVVESAYKTVKNDTSLADEYMQQLNTNDLQTTQYIPFDRSRKFYLSEYKKTKVIPKIIKCDSTMNIMAVTYYTPRILVEKDGKFYQTNYHSKSPNQPVLHTFGYHVKGVEYDDSYSIPVNLYYAFTSCKHVSRDREPVEIHSSTQYYAVVYEVYQDERLIGVR